MGRASDLFNGAGINTLAKRIAPTEEQRKYLQEQWNSLADHLKEKLYVRSGFPVSTWLQGSYKYGTLIRPIRKTDAYDVDVGVYFEWTDNKKEVPNAAQLRQWVQDELICYMDAFSGIVEVVTPPKQRCSRVIYAMQFHIDTPVYHFEPRQDKRRLASLSGQWEDSDPKAFYQWFKREVEANDRGQVQRLVRYLKAWSTIAFENASEARPSSILLTVLVVDAFNSFRWAYWNGVADDDALILIIQKIYKRLVKDAVVLNPVDRAENLNRITPEAWTAFLIRLRCLRDIVVRADSVVDEMQAALIWAEVFLFLMPLPHVSGVEFIDEAISGPIQPIPDLEVQLLAPSPSSSDERSLKNVSGVLCGQTIRITVSKPLDIPDDAIVEWTTRYNNSTTQHLSDLGHYKAGMKLLTFDTVMSYPGLHYVDCFIRLRGQISAVKRIPIAVQEDEVLKYTHTSVGEIFKCVINSKKSWI